MNIKISSGSLRNASEKIGKDLSEVLVGKSFARAVYTFGQGEQRSLSLEAVSQTGVDYLNENKIAYEKS